MKLIHTIGLVLLLGFFSSCRMVKAVKLIENGNVVPPAFKTEVPFEMRLGLVIIKVMIHGKEYRFILDTGAPNVISKELAQEMGFKAAGHIKSHDSQGNTASSDYTSIDSIGIGGLQFLSTAAGIADMRQSADIACFNADGLIGANLMRKAVWQFDYERHIITITNDRDSLIVPANAQIIKFHTALTGTPLIDVVLNGQTDHNVEVDLGSNSDFISSAETFEMLKKNGLSTNTYSYGVGASGLYGKSKEDTTWCAVVPSIQMGSLQLSNQVISFIKKGVKTVGTHFFKNYLLVFDWSRKELTMSPVSPFDNMSEKKYNFSLVLKDHQVFVGSRYYTGGAAVGGPQLGDQVLEVDGQDYRNCSGENWCTLASLRFEDSALTSSLLVKRGDKELNFKVVKEALFLKK